MLDFPSFPGELSNCDVQVFVGGGPNTTGAVKGWQQWERPRGATCSFMFGVGGGGGGAGGVTGATSTGGGGGAAGSPTRLIIPTLLLPERLFVRIGQGGAGGAGSANATFNAGTSGQSTYVCVEPNDLSGSTFNVLVASQGSAATNQTGGAATSGAVAATMVFGNLGLWQSANSSGGSNGGASGANGSAVTLLSGGALYSGGSGGGGQGAATLGGALTAASIFPTIQQATASHGSAGLAVSPFGSSTGGRGGCGAGTGGAFNGGDGAPGCGGGGGGTANATGPGGNGGRGGDGFVIIISW